MRARRTDGRPSKNGRIPFVSDLGFGRQVYTIRGNGTGLRHLTQLDGAAISPDWSPGRHLDHVLARGSGRLRHKRRRQRPARGDGAGWPGGVHARRGPPRVRAPTAPAEMESSLCATTASTLRPAPVDEPVSPRRALLDAVQRECRPFAKTCMLVRQAGRGVDAMACVRMPRHACEARVPGKEHARSPRSRPPGK